MAVGGAFQRDLTPLGDDRVPRRGQEVWRFRPSALFQFRVDVELSFRADSILVHIRHIAPVIALEKEEEDKNSFNSWIPEDKRISRRKKTK